MLIKCPECVLQVSDKAVSCPHCGYPLVKNVRSKKPRKRRRLPNGFGSITEVKGRRLYKPFYARVCVGKNEVGRPILKALQPQSYFATYNEAYEALLQYNKSPYELDKGITVKELYDEWIGKYKGNVVAETVATAEQSWLFCESVYDIPVSMVRARHIKYCMYDSKRISKKDGTEISPSLTGRKNIKTLFNNLLDYALEYEIVSTNYARTFSIEKSDIEDMEENRKGHISFTDEEMDTLWNNVDNHVVQQVLVCCYTGYRPQEMCNLELEHVNMDELYIQYGMKTKNGKNRIVPIHSKIQPIIKNIVDRSDGPLFTYQVGAISKQLTYNHYKYEFNKLIPELGLNPEHRLHDCRKTFVTMAKNKGVDEYAIKRIVGHSIQRDITEAVYTDRSLEWLRQEIEKI